MLVPEFPCSFILLTINGKLPSENNAITCVTQFQVVLTLSRTLMSVNLLLSNTYLRARLHETGSELKPV